MPPISFVRSALIVFALIAFSSASYADETCGPRADVLATCGEPWPDEMVSPNGNWPPPVEARASELKRMVNILNVGSKVVTRCAAAVRAAEAACDGEEDRFEAARRRYMSKAGYVIGWRPTLISRSSRLATAQNHAVTCLATASPFGPIETCYILDRTRPQTRVVSNAHSSDLPLTVGMAGLCSFTVDPFARLLTADHCGNTLDQVGSILWPIGQRRTSQKLVDRLPHSRSDIEHGQPFEDLAVWVGGGASPGRKFFFLVRDQSRVQDCGVKDDLYLACAPSVFRTLTGRRAQAIGFPTSFYPRRDVAESVVQSEGDLIYDETSRRYLIHAAVSFGFSGGPTLLPAGERVGGIYLDRPLYLGPISGFAPQRPPNKAFETDVLAIVAVYDEARVRSVLPPYAQGPSASVIR